MKYDKVKNAVVEVLVIVMGVLIALLAESTWNDYQNRIAGNDYAARLSSELKRNLEHLDTDLIWTRHACASTETALTMLRDPGSQPDPAEMLRLIISTVIYPAPEYRKATYDDLVSTGNMALIDDISAREQTVGVYTEFFEYIAAWRPPRDTDIRKAALRSLPSEYIASVVEECLVMFDQNVFAPQMRDCDTVPASGTPADWYEKITANSNLEAALSERAWQVCDFERTMGDIKEEIEALIPVLDEIGV